MHARHTLGLILLLATPGTLLAQHGQGGSPPATSAPPEARQFDFLIGQWELVVKVPAVGLAQRIHGTPKLVGTWKGWRAYDGFGVEDELRITDAAGNPKSLSHAMRAYDRAARQWNVATLDVFRGRITPSTASWAENQMSSTARGTDPEGKPMLSRSRFYDITPTSFRWQQDRSTDDGKTWTEGTLRISATRVAAVAPR